ncbi:MAG: GAF domain-containing protein [Bacteroidales bacterium]|nr:GAF domain-containing protein [Bacteroidales bacterium]MBN2820172.1 GAF domain-containing protein [Bacteroidales bacterium]
MNSKQKKYNRLIHQLEPLLKNSPSLNAQLATINALLYHKVPYIFWVGFYFIKNDELIVGPYQGPLACQVLTKPKGVCWASVLKSEPIIVADVEDFPDHIACDSRSKSEIVIPVKDTSGKVVGVLDIDSDKTEQFDRDDLAGLSGILNLINKKFL